MKRRRVAFVFNEHSAITPEQLATLLAARGDCRIVPDTGTAPVLRHLDCGASATETSVQQGPESDLLEHIRALAKQYGWLTYHTHRSQRSEPGFPDIVLCKPGKPVILAELKSASGKVTQEQALWLSFLGHATGIESYLWRPSDWTLIQQILTS